MTPEETAALISRIAACEPKIEEWKPIINTDGGYLISNLGRVKSIDRSIKRSGGRTSRVKGRMLSLGTSRGGYKTCRVNEARIIKVHREVAKSFIGLPPKSKNCVNHINGIKTDNRPENLEWCTYSHNLNHAIDTGLRPTKLSTLGVRVVRRLIDFGMWQDHIADVFGVSQTTISEINTGKKWTRIEAICERGKR